MGGNIFCNDPSVIAATGIWYPINDSMTVTPVIYLKEDSGDHDTGVIVKTSFSF